MSGHHDSFVRVLHICNIEGHFDKNHTCFYISVTTKKRSTLENYPLWTNLMMMLVLLSLSVWLWHAFFSAAARSPCCVFKNPSLKRGWKRCCLVVDLIELEGRKPLTHEVWISSTSYIFVQLKKAHSWVA